VTTKAPSSPFVSVTPLLPFLVLDDVPAFVSSVALSLTSCSGLGLGVSLLTKRRPFTAACANCRWCGVAALFTYLIGHAVGMAL
jgi:VIT1/CCC1 family predicted Fe2+/Mn2+ transporter